jgi:hypothetical protein
MFNDRRFFTKRLKNHQLTAYEQLFVRFLLHRLHFSNKNWKSRRFNNSEACIINKINRLHVKRKHF